MGISNASKECIYTIDGLSLDDVITIIRHRHSKPFQNVEDSGQPPTIDIDGNLWGCKWSSRDGGSVPVITDLVKQFYFKSICVAVGVDGKERHHSKIASTQRAAKREKARIAAFAARLDINNVTHSLENESLTADERNILVSKLEELERTVKS